MIESSTPTISQLHQQLSQRQLSVTELLESQLEVIQREEPRIHAFLRITEELAREQAAEADRRFKAGLAGPLTGIPIGIKDIICVAGVETTAASKILTGFRPSYDATCVARLREAGVIFLGMTNCDEFAMGSSNENSAYLPVCNPHDPTRVPGGSSGGSAAAVAAGEVVASLGTDTGGSIRQPAALCGVVGMKPTYGRVSRFGVIAFSSSMDQVGPFGRSVEDVAQLLQVIAGCDPKDSTSADRPLDALTGLERGVKGLRIGIPQEYSQVEGMEAGVRMAVEHALSQLEQAGAELVEVSLPNFKYGLAAYYIIAPAEASSNLARFDSVRYGLRVNEEDDSLLGTYLATRREGFGPEVRRRIMLGTHVLSAGYYDAYYLKAQKVRTLIARDFARAFDDCDVIASATSPCVAFPLGAKTADPMQMYLNDLLTLGANLAGLPGISVSCGMAVPPAEGNGHSPPLPIGLQFLAPQWEDARVLQVARAYELIRDGS